MTPEKFDNDQTGEKARWRGDLLAKLKEVVNKEENGGLDKSTIENKAYHGHPSLFDPDAEIEVLEAIKGNAFAKTELPVIGKGGKPPKAKIRRRESAPIIGTMNNPPLQTDASKRPAMAGGLLAGINKTRKERPEMAGGLLAGINKAGQKRPEMAGGLLAGISKAGLKKGRKKVSRRCSTPVPVATFLDSINKVKKDEEVQSLDEIEERDVNSRRSNPSEIQGDGGHLESKDELKGASSERVARARRNSTPAAGLLAAIHKRQTDITDGDGNEEASAARVAPSP
eukprot:CAMPEP_0185762666 /NCGR_PEP_ID=MMETSP1174-20130828/21629_1 /TAXON_ID=35687 /ORGANISM="Dictyocha speculum, Strain CCMP1381" /LENGTH=283 /DNA_ID=CAMNT_0028444429 /DNA_START=21 /DNA_END=872 /DNA_ORIENTATION=-